MTNNNANANNIYIYIQICPFVLIYIYIYIKTNGQIWVTSLNSNHYKSVPYGRQSLPHSLGD